MSDKYVNQEGRGALFKVTDKKGESFPDYSGNLVVGGIECYVSGWIKKSKGGKTYMSLSVKPKEARRDNQRDQVKPQEDTRPPFDDEIPF